MIFKVKKRNGKIVEVSDTQIIELSKTHSFERMAPVLGLSYGSLNGIINSNKIPVCRDIDRYYIDPQFLLSELKTKSVSEIARELNVPQTRIKWMLKSHNLMDKYYEVKKERSLPKFNFNYFETIDTEEKAYWLGFLFADGCVRKSSKNPNHNSYSIILALQRRDLNHIKKFKKAVESTKNIRYESSNKSYSMHLVSTKMFDDLNKLGCVQRKSLILDWPKGVPDNLMRHFIRGYFDGDGCLSIIHNPHKSYSVSFVSSEIFLNKLRFFLNKELKVTLKNVSKINPDKKYGTINFSKYSDMRIILDYLYKDSNIYLNRKYSRYLKFLKYKLKKEFRRDDITGSKIIELSKKLSLNEIATHFNTSETVLYKYLKKDEQWNNYKQIQVSKSKYTPIQISCEEILNMYKCNTIKQIGLQINQTTTAVLNFLRKNGYYNQYKLIKMNKRPSKITDKEIIDVWDSTIRNAAKKLGMSEITLGKIIRKRNIKKREV